MLNSYSLAPSALPRSSSPFKAGSNLQHIRAFTLNPGPSRTLATVNLPCMKSKNRTLCPHRYSKSQNLKCHSQASRRTLTTLIRVSSLSCITPACPNTIVTCTFRRRSTSASRSSLCSQQIKQTGLQRRLRKMKSFRFRKMRRSRSIKKEFRLRNRPSWLTSPLIGSISFSHQPRSTLGKITSMNLLGETISKIASYSWFNVWPKIRPMGQWCLSDTSYTTWSLMMAKLSLVLIRRWCLCHRSALGVMNRTQVLAWTPRSTSQFLTLTRNGKTRLNSL